MKKRDGSDDDDDGDDGAASSQSQLEFNPPLSERKRFVLEHRFRMEAATKLVYCFSERLWDSELTYMAHLGTVARWWTPGYGRDKGDTSSSSSSSSRRHLIVAYITAHRAQEIDALPEREALEVGLRELAQLLPPQGLKKKKKLTVDELRQRLVISKRVAWAKDPFALGGYAHVLPSSTAAVYHNNKVLVDASEDPRCVLAEPEEKTLFFAGEATAYHSNPQTVHGALDTGIRAAKQYLTSSVQSKL